MFTARRLYNEDLATCHIGTMTREDATMARVRLSVDLDPDLKRRLRVAAASRDQSVREWVEQAIAEALEREEDRGWMESDLSRLGEIEPYEWEEGELEQGYPVRYIPGVGTVIDMTGEHDDGGKHE